MVVKESTTEAGVKVKVTYPDPKEIPEYIFREKINALYDLLKPQRAQKKQ